MRILLDTHIFLWFVNDNPRLSSRFADLIEDENNIVYLSIASLWEMSIKYNLGKLTLKLNYNEFIESEVVASNINLLNIELAHIKTNAILPFHHRDPFDRLIISQSIVEKIPIITVDSVFSQYPVSVIS